MKNGRGARKGGQRGGCHYKGSSFQENQTVLYHDYGDHHASVHGVKLQRTIDTNTHKCRLKNGENGIRSTI